MLLYNELQFFCRIPLLVALIVFYRFTGLAFIDVKTLKRSDISADANGNMWIRKNREKTEELSVIPLLDVPQTIMRKYSGHPVVLTTGVVLPVMSNQKVNAYLKEIADLAKISKHLTSHIARHTYATLQIAAGTDIYTVSKMLTHKNVTTTQIYADLVSSKKRETVGRIKLK